MKNRQALPIGVVASGTTREGMTFYAQNRIRTDHVCVYEDETRTIYEVLRETVRNDRLMDADMVRFINPEDDYRSYNVYIGEAAPVACLRKNGRVYQDPYAIAAPGSWVYQADKKDLARVYDIAPGKGREKIGTLLREKDVNVYLDLKQFLQRQVHLAVVGRTGAGKSWFVQHMLERLPMRCIVFSPTDEYDALRMGHETRRKNDVVLPLDIDIAKRIFDLNASERNYLQQFLKGGMECRTYPAEELAQAIRAYCLQTASAKKQSQQMSLLASPEPDTLPQYAASLCQKIENVECSFQKLDAKAGEDQVSVVYNLQGCRRTEEERIIYSTLFPIFEKRKELFNSAGQDGMEDIVIVLEEAQNYAPSNRSTLCKDLLVDIARTGRKYGMHILLLSQRPRYIDQTILSQCGGGVFFHLPNPEDVDYVMTSVSLERSTPFKHMIHNFGTGECIFLRAEKTSLDLICKISASWD